MSDKPKVVIHTDGACSGNPGPGGWGAILQSGQHRKELKGGEQLTTNNRMELIAAIVRARSAKAPSEVDLYTNSNYLRGGITSWIKGWKRNGWRTADRSPCAISSYGSGWSRPRARITSAGTGSGAITAMTRTSAPTSLHARAWPHSCAHRKRQSDA